MNATAGFLVVLAAATACGGSLEPEDVAGSYSLIAINEAALPYSLPETGDCEQSVDEGELQLTSAGSYFIEFGGPMTCPGNDNSRFGRAYVGSYRISGDELRFETVLAGGELLQFTGDSDDGAVRASVPPLPPLEGPDLLLGFSRAP